MKKVLAVAVIFIMLVMTFVTGVSAVSTTELVEQLYAKAQPYGATAADKVKLERFFADNPVTEEQANQILAKADEAVAVMQEAGATRISDLTVEQKSRLKSIANEAASIVGVSLVFRAGTVEIYKDGKLIETLTHSGGTGTLAYTGNSTNTVLVVSSIAGIALVATAAVVARKRLANA